MNERPHTRIPKLTHHVAMIVLVGLLAAAGCRPQNQGSDDHGHSHGPDQSHSHGEDQDDSRIEVESQGHDHSQSHDHSDGQNHDHSQDQGDSHSQVPSDDHSEGQDHDHSPGQGHSHEEPDEVSKATDCIATPESVRRNLGINFVTVERRPVRSTLRIAGQFELRPAARRDYHVVMPGRIELLVRQYERVSAGQPLFHLDSPEWQKLQSDLVDALSAMKRSHADVAVAEAKLQEMQRSIEFVEQRIASLAEAQVRRVELESELAEKRNALPRLEAELTAARTEFDTVHSRYDVMLRKASSLTGIPREELDSQDDGHGHLKGQTPPWREVKRLTIRAEAPGAVDRLPVTNRGWVETGDLVLDTVDPAMLRFHADALQTDIMRFADGQPARIVPPQGGSFDLQDTADGNIEIGFEAHLEQRTIPIYLVPQQLPRWAKAGVNAYLEVFTGGNESPVLAIPEAAVIRDGLDRVFFRRDRNNPDQVIRVVADLGVSDNRWVEVRSGVREGDEIVLDGVYPLMLASSSSGAIQEGGHVHPDGTFHEAGEH